MTEDSKGRGSELVRSTFTFQSSSESHPLVLRDSQRCTWLAASEL